ncbi:MAG: hypothetical protein Q7S20_04200 [Gemmatimonadaceae bacterium]|nr:hypothetical protein [Gemmatimonadaceae bacterium]
MILSRASGIRLAGVLLAAALAAGCKPNARILDNRQWSDSFAFRITVDPMPPRAIEDARYRIVVQDKKTGEPIETGEGRIFATSSDGANTDDGFQKGKEVGTYYGRLFFPTSGDWAMALQFRRDSTQKLEKVDWVQTVNNATAQ